MKITDVTVNQLRSFQSDAAARIERRPGRLLVQVFTDEGVVGVAEGSRHYGMFKACVEDVVKPLIVGMSPVQPRRIWEILSLGLNETKPGIPSQIVGAIDIACWDITGKVAGLPLYTLFGGASRTEIPLYWSVGSGWKKTPEEMLDNIQEGYEKGFRSFKVRMDWKDYRQDSNPQKDLAIFKKCREWLPDDIPLGFDANNGYSVSTAIEQGRRFEDLGIAHFEEPIPQYDLRGLRQVVDALDCAVSTGEQETSAFRFRDLIDLANPDILQPDVLNVGGLSEMLRVFDIAVVNNKVLMPHSPNLGLNSLASLHAYSTITNATRPHEFSEEFTGPIEQVAQLFENPIVPEGGTLTLSDRPGLGVTLNQEIVKQSIVA